MDIFSLCMCSGRIRRLFTRHTVTSLVESKICGASGGLMREEFIPCFEFKPAKFHILGETLDKGAIQFQNTFLPNSPMTLTAIWHARGRESLYGWSSSVWKITVCSQIKPSRTSHNMIRRSNRPGPAELGQLPSVFKSIIWGALWMITGLPWCRKLILESPLANNSCMQYLVNN